MNTKRHTGGSLFRNISIGHGWILHLICWLAISTRWVSGQVGPAPGGNQAAQSIPEHQKEIGRLVLGQLRDGNPQQALKTLEVPADLASPISSVDDDFLGPALAGLNRSLSQLDHEDQFNLLYKWSISGTATKKIRQLTALVPIIAPPAEFGRALGERPRGNSFPVSSIGSVRGIYSTAWSLVIAAREAGKLKRLTTELAALVDQKIAQADLLLMLARIVDGRSDVAIVDDKLTERTNQLKAAARPAGGATGTVDPADLLLAVCALNHQALCPHAEEMLSVLLARTDRQSAAAIRPFLRQAHAVACLASAGGTGDVASALSPQLRYWIPVSKDLSESPSLRPGLASWLVHEDYILHLCGAPSDSLLFRYPLTGDFQFQCETQLGGQFETDGLVSYGGLRFETTGTSGEFRIRDENGKLIGKRYCHYAQWPTGGGFHRVSVGSTASSATLFVDLHPMWVDSSGFQASPWLGLTSPGDCRPVFRNFKLTGHPVIPRIVRLSDGDLLRGWQSQAWGDGQLSKTKLGSDWNIAKGMIQAASVKPDDRQKSDSASIVRDQRLLSYERPLLAGETIRYEFFHESGVSEIHPALGRVGFLLEPDGVRLHWITDGHEWTSLAAENTVVEPLCRRGPRPLPFKANDWNRLSLHRTEQAVTLSLNEVVIYQRPVDWADDQRFGLYRHGVDTEVKVRDVELTGDWPETVPPQFLEDPTATVGEPIKITQRHAIDGIIQDELLADNVLAIRRRALMMPAAERFDFLSRWVLPGPDHPSFRMTGDFTQTQPVAAAMEPGADDPEAGAQMISPVFDWLDVAKVLGRLPDCQKRVEGTTVLDTESQRRAKIALLLLLNLEQKDEAAAMASFEEFYKLLRAATEDHWSEMLVVDRCCRKFADSGLVAKFIADIRALKVQQSRPWRNKVWQSQVGSLLNQAQSLTSREGVANQYPPGDLKDWIPVTGATSATRGQGLPVARWRKSYGKVVKVTSHDEDFLFYRSPLGGNFEVECDVLDLTHVMTAGSYLGPRFDTRNLDLGTFRAIAPSEVIVPPFTSFVHRVHVRTAIRDGSRTISFNGRNFRVEKLPENRDPWIAVRCYGRNQGGVLDLRITGNPKVLDAVSLSDSKDLTGWIPYHDEPVPHEKYGWTHVDDPESTGWIVGHANPGMGDGFTEGLLRYQRPLVEDGSIEYEFFYDPDKFETHPALDRLAFLLHPSGIREHWIGDGRYDRTELNPQNAIDVPECRRGPAELPMVAGDWNRLKLQFVGSTITIELNGVRVYERKLEPTNLRTFGLFHFLGNTAVRVRNAVMRGDWPKTLPKVTSQELVDVTTDMLDADLSGLKSVFSHNFQKDGAPDRFFKVPVSSNTLGIMRTPKGLQITQHAAGPHVGGNIGLRFTLCGDFDVEASFAGLRTEGTGDSGIMLNASVAGEPRHDFRALRMKTAAGNNDLHQSLGLIRSDGGQAYVGTSIPFESLNGRVRLSRRGNRVHYLFAEGESEHFFSFGSEPATDADTAPDGVFLHFFCNGVGLVQVTWTKLILRAERIKWHSEIPQQAQELLSVMQANGKALKTIAAPKSVGFTNVAAPEWSADGRRIVMEMSNGPPASSHVFAINADGSDLKDLGLGSIPSFSHDGSRIVCSQQGKGIVTMQADGTDRRVIAASGWAAQWSPDGRCIAFGEDGNITLLDVNSNATSKLLKGDAATRYRSIINLGWSRNSHSIAFKAERADIARQELCIAELGAPEKFQIVHPNAHAVNPDIAFSPDDQQVLVSIQKANSPERKLSLLSRKQPGPPQQFAAQLTDHRVSGYAWSNDGKSIVITSRFAPQYVEWLTGPVTDVRPR